MRACAIAITLATAAIAAAEWPGFRGDSTAIALGSAPTDWSIEEGRNIAWKADLPGRGVSGPIVIGDRVIVTASDGPRRERLHVVAYSVATGERLWSRRIWATGRTLCHPTSAGAAATPASDGQRVFAFFSSSDLVCLGLDGSVQWVRGLTLDHPGVGNDTGMAASPVVVDNAVVVQAECQGDSFAIAVDRRTGETLWEVPRPQQANWSSPLPWTAPGGKPAVWLQDGEGASLHDATSGERLARIETSCPTIPSPTAAGAGRLLLATGGVSLFSPPYAEPDLQISKLQPGSPSPVVFSDKVLVVNRGGVLACGDLETGDILWRRRLGGQFWATPTIAGGHAYCVNSKGEATVVRLEGGRVVSKHAFGEDILGAPAVSGGAIYFRSHDHLWKIATTKQAQATPANETAAR